MSDSTSQKIALGLRQLHADIDEQSKNMTSPTARARWGGYMDRIAGFAAELEAEVASGEGVAGTHAYDMMAAVEMQHTDATIMLIDMVAATVLMLGVEKRIDFHNAAGGERTVTFSPLDMDAMHKGYEMTATRDGMATTVHIKRRAMPELGLTSEPGPDDSPALPQAAEHTYERPYWFAKIGPERISVDDRDSAELLVQDSLRLDSGIVAEVENRQCPRPECPNSEKQGMCPSCSAI